MKKSLILWLFAFALPAFGQTSPPAADDATAAITHLREGLITAFNAKDIDGLLTYLDPDVVVTWQNAELCQGPEAVRAYYNKMMTGDRRPVRAIKSEPEVLGRHVYGDWAVSWGNMHDRFILNDGSDLPLNSVFTATIAKRGDRWLVTAFHVSVNVFENPVLGAAIRRTALPLGIGSFIGGLVLGLLAMKVFKRQSAES